MAWQPEDQHRSDMGKILKGTSPQYRDKWRERSTRSLPSANWEEQSSGLAVWDGWGPGIAYLKNRIATGTNNFLRGETVADAAHYTFSLEALMFQRRFTTDPVLRNLIDEEVLQWWAQILLNSNTPTLSKATIFAFAHQRTVPPTGSRTLIDYYWRRGLGLSHTGTGMAQAGERVARDQAPFNGKLFADKFQAEFKADINRLLEAHRTQGWVGVSKFIKRGSRGVWHWVRFENGGSLMAIEQDIGVDEPRYLARYLGVGTPLIQFPEGTCRRNNRNGGCEINFLTGRIEARDSEYGEYSGTFDPSKIILHLKSSPAGVERVR